MKKIIFISSLFWLLPLFAMQLVRELKSKKQFGVTMQNNFCTTKDKTEACRCFTPEINKRAELKGDAAKLWKTHHLQAIRHKITDKNFDLTDIEMHDWVVTCEYGQTWKNYSKPARIVFARKRKLREYKKIILYGNNYFLGTYNPFFKLSVNNDCITFTSQESGQFSMAIDIDPIEIPRASKTDSFAKCVEIGEISAECIMHWEMDIPWYIMLKDSKNITAFKNHQKIERVSLSANGYNMLTKLPSGSMYLWSIEHMVRKDD